MISQPFKPYTIDELVTAMWEDAEDHRYDEKNDILSDCDCGLCNAISIVQTYMQKLGSESCPFFWGAEIGQIGHLRYVIKITDFTNVIKITLRYVSYFEMITIRALRSPLRYGRISL